MTIQLALSAKYTGPASSDSLDHILSAAQVIQFPGIELATRQPEDLPNPKEIRQKIESAGLKIACLATALRLDTWNNTDILQAGRSAIETAAELNADVLRVWGGQTAKGEGRGESITRIGKRLAALGQMAADRHPSLKIALENGGSFCSSKDLWALCEVARENDGGSVGVAWDVVTAARLGENPTLSVPTLNSKLLYARAYDALAPAFSHPVTLSTGQIKIKTFIERLRGIGYQGWLTYSPPSPETLTIEEQATDLETAAQLFRQWISPEPPKKHHKPAHATH